MQRLFTTFPNGWPGAGLLLLRITLAVPLLLDGGTWATSGGPDAVATLIRLIGAASGSLLIGGLWTPVPALLAVLTELWLTYSIPALSNLHLTRAAIGLALAGMGPGAWSVDSRLYGRKRIDI